MKEEYNGRKRKENGKGRERYKREKTNKKYIIAAIKLK